MTAPNGTRPGRASAVPGDPDTGTRIFSRRDYETATVLVATITRRRVDNLEAFARRVGRSRAWVRQRVGDEPEAALPVAALLRGGRAGLRVMSELMALEWGVEVSSPARLHHPITMGERLARCAAELLDVVREQAERAADGEWCAQDRAVLLREVDEAIACLQAERRALMLGSMRPMAKASPDGELEVACGE